MLKLVTITGADDKTDITNLRALSNEFPFVEWGILIGSHNGGPRFPSIKWLNNLAHMAGVAGMHFSTHMCGSYVRELLRGHLSLDSLPAVFNISQRVQINTHGIVHGSNTKFIYELSAWAKEFIFQLDGVNDHLLTAAKGHCLTFDQDNLAVNCSGLFDLSHGAGTLPDNWPTSIDWRGYAGGLSPENVIEQLEKIFKVAKGHFWIDMETKVRSDDDNYLDLEKVYKVLELCAPYLEDKTGD